mgnify:CR=1 FL=1
MTLTDRFLKYVSFDTQSSTESDKTPSSDKQLVLADFIKDELMHLGLENVERNGYGFVYANLPSNSNKVNVPSVGFIAHLDTSPDCSGANVKPRIISNYDGSDIKLENGTVSSVNKFPELLNYIGNDLIVTDGNTLLGADDKAGIAEIVSACEFFISHPEIKHGDIKIAFTPDEEIGLGVKKFDVDKFGADFAYTMDGSELGELEYENFNAAFAKIYFKGLSVHPGYAKGKMINAARIATEFVQMLPQNITPEHTAGYEGFFHVISINGNCEKASVEIIIRNHDMDKFSAMKCTIENIVDVLNAKYGKIVDANLQDQYYNMKEYVPDFVVNFAIDAMKLANISPIVKPIRGGTDGAQLSLRGLPCPNIFAGGVNFHGPHEFCSIQTMTKAVDTIVNICRLVEGKA